MLLDEVCSSKLRLTCLGIFRERWNEMQSIWPTRSRKICVLIIDDGDGLTLSFPLVNSLKLALHIPSRSSLVSYRSITSSVQLQILFFPFSPRHPPILVHANIHSSHYLAHYFRIYLRLLALWIHVSLSLTFTLHKAVCGTAWKQCVNNKVETRACLQLSNQIQF